ncbi:hypothetical protein [Phytohabitans rumicis]|uniref:Uncharacterized protein n=1 Tax=Phytohabitans rumicis TaxID=1076125 RepID=A0A6V8L2K9_9ACTN|nr:hypothetical protein [Phytohabitans rumicis]GFJ89780.1 hypothetical protein Prum_034220 [Phytohabitans rumicis]
MALRTWSKVLLAALGVGLLAGASQLGVAFGLGIVRLSRTFPTGEENQWTAQMAWVTWFAMVAAVAGAVAADRMARRHGHVGGTGSRIAYAVCAGIGAAVLVPLCMQPARFAQVQSTDPVLVIGLSAALGAIAGVFVAIAALSQESLLWNVVVVTAGGWLLAIISVAPSLGSGDPLTDVRLGVPDLASLSTGTTQSLAVMTMPLLALVGGAAIAGVGRWLGRPPMTIAASGLIGPAMMCLAYLVAGPGSSADKYQAAPYWGALVAVGAGVLGSVLATAARRPTFPSRRPEPDSAPSPSPAPSPPSAAPRPSQSSASSPSLPDEPTADLSRGSSDDEPSTVDLARSTNEGRPARRPPPAARESAVGGAVTAFAAGRRAAARQAQPDDPAASTPAPARPSKAAPKDAPGDRPRKGLFGRRRATPAPPEPDPEPIPKGDVPTQRGSQTRPEAPLKPRDEEYVDWVSGLSTDPDKDRP